MSVAVPARIGSYDPDDVTFLLKDVSDAVLELDVDSRERKMQGTGHYSETLPIEYRPTAAYKRLFERLLARDARRIALLTCTLADLLAERHPRGPVLVSLARAGTPVGVLLRRAIRRRHGLDAPHYSVSIIRDRGIDEVALRYVLAHHPADAVQFVDGWTGKGVIGDELARAVADAGARLGAALDPALAVLADPANATTLFATREDVLIPSACLNSTVSGLVSRTVLNADLVGPGDFHGAKWYREFADEDVSRRFVDTIAACFDAVAGDVAAQRAEAERQPPPDGRGLRETRAIAAEHGLRDVNLVKPSIGETTRVLLRRRPWKVLVDPGAHADLEHVRALCAERDVPIVERPMSYAACGLIRPVAGGAQ